jgi:hypothetical protein
VALNLDFFKRSSHASGQYLLVLKRLHRAPQRDRKSKQNSKDENDEFTGGQESLSRAKRIQLPLELGNRLKVIADGTIVTNRPGFHNAPYISPADSTSALNPTEQA